MEEKTKKLQILIALQQQALAVPDVIGLTFLVANETWQLVPYQQAAVFVRDAFGRSRLKAISGLVSNLENTPFTQWVYQIEACLNKNDPVDITQFTAHDLPKTLQKGWGEWWPENALKMPLVTSKGDHIGDVFFVRDEPWTESELKLLVIINKLYAHCFNAYRSRATLLRRLLAPSKRKWLFVLTAFALACLLSMPVRLSVLAPAEIIALNSEVVAAPANGVIKEFHIMPNQPVEEGQLLFTLDNTTIRNQRDVAQQSLAVARAKALAMAQRSFNDSESKADLVVLQGIVAEKEAELAHMDELLERTNVFAAHNGIFVYSDVNDWVGRPVITGERVGRLSQPDELGVLAWLPVSDAVSLDIGADMRIYLQVAPLNALHAELIETSYQASLSPDNISSYRIRGKLTSDKKVHLGLKGVAKIYGEHKQLIYWLFRRPFGALRQWVGI